MAELINGFNVNGILAEVDLTKAGKLTSENGTLFNFKITDKGEIYTYSGDVDPKQEKVAPLTPPSPTDTVSSLTKNTTYKLYINSLYCGGANADEHTLNYCTHNFVELSNLTGQDINLEGMSLQYAVDSTGWYVLPLKGVIKNGSTFLIRGAECAARDFAKIKVDSYDMEWRLADGNLIKFSSERAKFFLTFKTTATAEVNPWGDGKSVLTSYIDLIGIDGEGENKADGYEGTAYPKLSTKNLYKKYYSMDPVKQTTKDLSARSNNKLWNYVDLSKDNGDVIPNIEAFTPKASSEGKSIFTDKTYVEDGKPSMITCSFGIQATDNGDGATRCFNWLSRGLHDEFIWIKKHSVSEWGAANESFKNETGIRANYNRITKEVSDGTVITAHKFIKKNLEAGVWDYIAGRKNADGTPDLTKCTDVHSFTVRTNSDVDTNGFSFVQTSDQQGFNWDEYQVWGAASTLIMKEFPNVQFMINTGDIAQNGNRMNEWLDYFDAKCDKMNNIEEMATVGNNDLSPKDLYKLGDGEDTSKLSLDNYNFFFMAEIDEENAPVFDINSISYFVPSLYSFNYGNTHFLCMNTEIKKKAENNPSPAKDIYESPYPFASYGNLYPKIQEWCEQDIENNSGAQWNIVFCHEMPFTLLTTGVTKNPVESVKTPRTQDGGCNANYNTSSDKQFWFGEFCQTHNVRLVLGGHKHTQATSWPILENISYNGGVRTVDSWHTKIILPVATIDGEPNPEFVSAIKEIGGNEATSLVEVTVDGVTRKYPNTWVSGGAITTEASGKTYFCEFDTVDNLAEGEVPVIYAMSQASGYKHTSNKELPAAGIPWLRYYYPTALNATKPDGKQKAPFFTVWNVTNAAIKGNVRKCVGILNAGTFDINIDGPYVKNGYQTGDYTKLIKSDNGLSSSTNGDSTAIIEIKH